MDRILSETFASSDYVDEEIGHLLADTSAPIPERKVSVASIHSHGDSDDNDSNLNLAYK